MKMPKPKTATAKSSKSGFRTPYKSAVPVSRSGGRGMSRGSGRGGR